MNALQHFNPGTVVEWLHADQSTAEVSVFKYVFWTFKPCIKGFKRCRPVISIDGTHIYGKYDLKMLIVVTADANGQIFPLAFAIVDKETKEAWSWFLSYFGIHVVAGRRGVTYISDRAPGILRSFDDLVELHEPNAYLRFCLRHVKSDFLSKYPKKQLEGLMWQATIQHQERKFKVVMQCLKDAKPEAYNYLMKIPLEKWTVHRDGGRRWGILTTNLSESFNGFLKKSRGLPVTAMIKLTYGQIVERFVSRKQYAQDLIDAQELWPPVVSRKYLKYELKSKNHKVIAYSRETCVFEVETYRREGRGGRKHIIKFRWQKTYY
ncbi:uncharacterized protein LOC132061133 [Lycium ferocissimum]|uniref:uncharacterized protein LOC132061133 n=1 Tax=Lycium ferocissimum TaxID=112874 RepID=UPI002815CEA8|nr:uncharacterized protein LOC132061133 [Lycium ferocissimum]